MCVCVRVYTSMEVVVRALRSYDYEQRRCMTTFFHPRFVIRRGKKEKKKEIRSLLFPLGRHWHDFSCNSFAAAHRGLVVSRCFTWWSISPSSGGGDERFFNFSKMRRRSVCFNFGTIEFSSREKKWKIPGRGEGEEREGGLLQVH